jgi:succinyl-CoA:acetate CoA-transferase
MSGQEAAALIPSGVNVGMSGFTGSGYPKDIPVALAQRITEAHQAGQEFKIELWTGASTAPELDGELTKAAGVELRLPYQSDPTSRKSINAGETEYIDLHLSHVPQFVRFGFLGQLDIAIIEVTSILEDGRLVPSTSIGNNKTWLDLAAGVILEVNAWQNEKLEGMHDIYYYSHLPPRRQPIPIVNPDDRIGSPYLLCPPEKIIGIVETNAPDRNTPFSPPDEASQHIAAHILEFLAHEIKHGRLPADVLPLQSGVGNIANAVLAGLNEGPYTNLTAYTEVIQDGMLDMLRSGKLLCASATAIALSLSAFDEFTKNIDDYRQRIILRSQGISNHPEVIRRLGVLAMNGMLEADIYGNVNSTHVMGTQMMNGIGGSGDFARNAYISFFMAPSTAKDGAISTIVPMVSHVDHTEHDTEVLVTEQGLADLRGLSPKQRAVRIIETCVHPDYKPALREYYQRALELSPGKHTPHLLDEAFNWHMRYTRTGHM